MERCPNCGSPGRPGAKFCTTCGFQFSDDDEAATVDDAAGLIAPAGTGENGEAAAEPATGWPSHPASREEPGTMASAQPGSSLPATTFGQDPEEADGIPTVWPEEAVDPWPAPPASVANDADPDEPSPGNPFASGSAADLDAPAAHHPEIATAVARAERLLDELRDTIATIGQETSTDLSGVVSDLEVAVTPPGSLPADEVTELREALLAARERPRDVDTIVDITKRVDSMVALVFAYDRTIAAIERSLDVLRRTETGVMGDGCQGDGVTG